MFAYYKRSLVSLFGMVKALRADPYGQSETCLAIQERLLRHITYIEQKIRECHASIRNLNKRLRTQQPTGITKGEAQAIKNEVSDSRHKIDEYRQLLTIFREIGDALAFTYIDKYDIKPLAMKEAPGFLSQKAGLRFELKTLRTVFSLGHVGIMNDLTNCLRYGDISVPKDGTLRFLFEAKSGKYPNSRTQRQFTKARKVINYLADDETDGLYGINGQFQRISLHSPEVHHRDQLNTLISSAEVGWKKRTPRSGKIDRRRCQHERDPARKVHPGIPPGSGQTGHRREVIFAGSRSSVVPGPLNPRLLAQGI
jgi:hypothetical protein